MDVISNIIFFFSPPLKIVDFWMLSPVDENIIKHIHAVALIYDTRELFKVYEKIENDEKKSVKILHIKSPQRGWNKIFNFRTLESHFTAVNDLNGGGKEIIV